jgi:hypothetical protein
MFRRYHIDIIDGRKFKGIVGVASVGIIFIPNLMKTRQVVEQFLGATVMILMHLYFVY